VELLSILLRGRRNTGSWSGALEETLAGAAQ